MSCNVGRNALIHAASINRGISVIFDRIVELLLATATVNAILFWRIGSCLIVGTLVFDLGFGFVVLIGERGNLALARIGITDTSSSTSASLSICKTSPTNYVFISAKRYSAVRMDCHSRYCYDRGLHLAEVDQLLHRHLQVHQVHCQQAHLLL